MGCTQCYFTSNCVAVRACVCRLWTMMSYFSSVISIFAWKRRSIWREHTLASRLVTLISSWNTTSFALFSVAGGFSQTGQKPAFVLTRRSSALILLSVVGLSMHLFVNQPLLVIMRSRVSCCSQVS